MSLLKHIHKETIAAFMVLAVILLLIDLAEVSAATLGQHAYSPKRSSLEVSALQAYPAAGKVEGSAYLSKGKMNTASYSGTGPVEKGAYPIPGSQTDPSLNAVVRGEQGPMLFIGGSMGISGEVFFGDMPVAPDPYAAEPGGDSSANGESGDAGNTDGNSGNTGEKDPGQAGDSADEEPEEDDWDRYLPPKPQGITLPGIRQNLDLIIDARLGESVQAYTRLSMSGVWGVSRSSDASPWMPSMIRPLLVDEAWVRYATEDFQVHAGKQRFSLGPIGLLGRTDLEAAEGIVLDTGSEKWGLTGVWSRLSSGYYYNSSFVTRADNLLAFRLAWPIADTWALGLNCLAGGLGDETGISVDVLGNTGGRNIAAEVGMFESSSTLYPEYRTSGWVPGFILKAEAVNTPEHRLEFSYGYLSRGFAPYYSSVASRSGGLAIPFDQNTQGIAVNYDRRLSPFTEVNLKVAHLRFLENEAAHNEGGNGNGDTSGTGQNGADRNSSGGNSAAGNSPGGNGAANKGAGGNGAAEEPMDGNGTEKKSTGENNAKGNITDENRTGKVTQHGLSMAQSEITPVALGSASIRHELKKNMFAEGKYEHWWMENGSNYGRLTAGINVNF